MGRQSKIAVCLVSVLLVTATSCVPEFDDAPYKIEGARILAIRGLPAEARPGSEVAYEVLVATPSGTQKSSIDLAYCTLGRRAEERTGVSALCLQGTGLQEIGGDAKLLSDACSRFGPNAPPSQGDEPAKRAADPDPSGGYYLPIQASLAEDGGVRSFGFHRIRCDLAGATRAIFEAFEEGYRENRHPQITTLTVSSGQKEAIDLEAQLALVSVGNSVELQLKVRADSFEKYIVYSAEEARLFDREEILYATWYVTAGELIHFDQKITELSPNTSNTWIAPSSPGTVHGWVVLRDDRGGSSWTEFEILVE